MFEQFQLTIMVDITAVVSPVAPLRARVCAETTRPCEKKPENKSL